MCRLEFCTERRPKREDRRAFNRSYVLCVKLQSYLGSKTVCRRESCPFHSLLQILNFRKLFQVIDNFHYYCEDCRYIECTQDPGLPVCYMVSTETKSQWLHWDCSEVLRLLGYKNESVFAHVNQELAKLPLNSTTNRLCLVPCGYRRGCAAQAKPERHPRLFWSEGGIYDPDARCTAFRCLEARNSSLGAYAEWATLPNGCIPAAYIIQSPSRTVTAQH